ncbi:hypothetical protein AGR1B_Cc120608 [Agrobacterium fabacearum S56]|nr:hypothetical protein AGR1B_Cc120608 [Agrobacterium fabacearum S56]
MSSRETGFDAAKGWQIMPWRTRNSPYSFFVATNFINFAQATKLGPKIAFYYVWSSVTAGRDEESFAPGGLKG